MNGFKHRNLSDIPCRQEDAGKFAYGRQEFLSKQEQANMVASVYTLPPRKGRLSLPSPHPPGRGVLHHQR